MRRIACLITMLATVATATVAQQQSVSWKSRTSLATAAGAAGSVSWTTVAGVAGGPGGASSPCASARVATVGGPLLPVGLEVPMILAAVPTEPDGVRLEWSGAASRYEVHRSAVAAATAGDPSVIALVDRCDFLDGDPPPSPILYYLVESLQASRGDLP